MTHPARSGASLASPALALLLMAGCSDASSAGEAEQAAHAASFAAAFESGFDAGLDSGPDATGLPFERAPARTSEVEAMVADNLADNFSFRFAMAEPESFIRSGQVRDVYRRELAARNLPGDTLAGATALMFGVAWEVANGRRLSSSDNAAILRQAAAMLRADPLEQQGDDARQAQADTALTIAGLWLEEADLRRDLPDRARELSDAVNRDMARMSGTDMRSRAIAAEGFVAR